MYGEIKILLFNFCSQKTVPTAFWYEVIFFRDFLIQKLNTEITLFMYLPNDNELTN